MPNGVDSVEARKRRVRFRDPQCTAFRPDGGLCKAEPTEAHHWFPRESPLREREEHMQGVCTNCHAAAHRWPGRFPPNRLPDEPFRLDVQGWPRRQP